MLGFLSVPMDAAYHVVFAIALFLAPLPAGFATAAAIVVFTVAVRLFLLPLSYRAFRGQRAMSDFGVKAQELRARYASQPDRLQRELAALYAAERPLCYLGGRERSELQGSFAALRMTGRTSCIAGHSRTTSPVSCGSAT